MKVKRLIEKLQRLDPDAEIVISYHTQNYWDQVMGLDPDPQEQFAYYDSGTLYLTEEEEKAERYGNGIAQRVYVL